LNHIREEETVSISTDRLPKRKRDGPTLFIWKKIRQPGKSLGTKLRDRSKIRKKGSGGLHLPEFFVFNEEDKKRKPTSWQY